MLSVRISFFPSTERTGKGVRERDREIDVLGQILFNNFLSCFLIAGLILLVAMVGAISLTLNYRSERKNELVIRQLSRSDNFLSFFK